jgi:hypothetical protein
MRWQGLTDKGIQILVHGGANAVAAMVFFPNKIALAVMIAVLSEAISQYIEEIIIPMV